MIKILFFFVFSLFLRGIPTHPINVESASEKTFPPLSSDMSLKQMLQELNRRTDGNPVYDHYRDEEIINNKMKQFLFLKTSTRPSLTAEQVYFCGRMPQTPYLCPTFGAADDTNHAGEGPPTTNSVFAKETLSFIDSQDHLQKPTKVFITHTHSKDPPQELQVLESGKVTLPDPLSQVDVIIMAFFQVEDAGLAKFVWFFNPIAKSSTKGP